MGARICYDADTAPVAEQPNGIAEVSSEPSLRIVVEEDAPPAHLRIDKLQHTPAPPEAALYKFYCPLCMCYLRVVWETGCCAHYTCFACAVDYISGNAPDGDAPLTELPSGPIPDTRCPHCALAPVAFTLVPSTCPPRLYTDSPSLRAPGGGGSSSIGPSPIRPGDTPDALHRKMVRFGDDRGPRRISRPPSIPRAPHDASPFKPTLIPQFTEAGSSVCPPPPPPHCGNDGRPAAGSPGQATPMGPLDSSFFGADEGEGDPVAALFCAPAGDAGDVVLPLTPQRPVVLTSLDGSRCEEEEEEEGEEEEKDTNPPPLQP